MAQFIIKGDDEKEIEVALFPGLAESVEKLKSWGFTADVIATNESTPQIIDTEPFCWNDFLKLVRSNTISFVKIVIQNKTNDPVLFDKSIIISKTNWSKQKVEDKICLQDYINIMAYDRTKISIDFYKGNIGRLVADGTLYMAMRVPPKAKFGIYFIY